MKFIIALILILTTLTINAQTRSGHFCDDAICLSANPSFTISLDRVGANPPFAFSCGEGETENNLFFAFCPASGPVNFQISVSNCRGGQGVEAVILRSDDCTDFEEIACQWSDFEGDISISMNGFPNQIYYLMIDGFQGSECDLFIRGSGLSPNMANPPRPEILPEGEIAVCLDEELTLEIANASEGCLNYRWDIIDGDGNISLFEDSDGTRASIVGEELGEARICVEAQSICFSETTCFWVDVEWPPEIDDVDTVFTCSEFVDFCNYQDFFQPRIYPDPIDEGWNISFHTSERDAQNNSNPIQCPYDLTSSNSHKIFIRIEENEQCYFIEEFDIVYGAPVIDAITNLQYCQEGSLNLTEEVVLTSIDGTEFRNLRFFNSRSDAENNRNQLDPAILTAPGRYEFFVRVGDNPSCELIRELVIFFHPSPQIEVENPSPICIQDGSLEFDLRTLECNEITSFYDCDTLDVRWYDNIPTPQNISDFLSPPIVYRPGEYWALANVEVIGGETCVSNVYKINLDTSGNQQIKIAIEEPGCPEDNFEFSLEIPIQTFLEIEYELYDGAGNIIFEDILLIPESNTSDRIDRIIDLDNNLAPGNIICVRFNLIESTGSCPVTLPDDICFEVPEYPTIEVRGNSTLCEGQQAELLIMSNFNDSARIILVNGVDTLVTGSFIGSDTITIEPMATGEYELYEVLFDEGCEPLLSGDVFYEVNQNPIPVISSSDTVICFGEQVEITLSDIDNFTQIQWGGLAQGQSGTGFSIGEAGIVTVEVADTNGCSGSDSLILQEFVDLPNTINGPMSVCVGEWVEYRVDNPNGFPLVWDIQGAHEVNYSNDSLIQLRAFETLNIALDVANGCQYINDFNVTVDGEICLLNDTLFFDSSALIEYTDFTDSCFHTFFTDRQMNTELIFPYNHFLDTIIYFENGEPPCTFLDSVFIVTKTQDRDDPFFEEDDDTIESLLYNAISPNQDGLNDYLELPDIFDGNQVDLVVFDRWGNIVYQVKNYQEDWSGSDSLGNPLPSGNYFYQISIGGKYYHSPIVVAYD
jgi:gliding motility-associated-like protein